MKRNIETIQQSLDSIQLNSDHSRVKLVSLNIAIHRVLFPVALSLPILDHSTNWYRLKTFFILMLFLLLFTFLFCYCYCCCYCIPLLMAISSSSSRISCCFITGLPLTRFICVVCDSLCPLVRMNPANHEHKVSYSKYVINHLGTFF